MPSDRLNRRDPVTRAPGLASFGSTPDLDAEATVLDKIARLVTTAEQLRSQGRLQAAIGSLQRAIALAPDRPSLHHHLAELYREARLTARAEQALVRARELEAQSPDSPSPAQSSAPPAAQPAAAVPAESSARMADLEELAGMSLTAEQKRTIHEQVQHLLVQLGELDLLLGSTSNRQVVSETRDHLKKALKASQRAARTELMATAPLPTQPLTVQADSPSAPSLALTQDLGPPGNPGFVSLGPEVAALQGILQRLGMDVPISGRYDRQTARAVKTFQRRHKLARCGGLVDGDTRQLLQRLSAGNAGDT